MNGSQLTAPPKVQLSAEEVQNLEVWSHDGEDSWCSACRKRQVPTILMGIRSKFFFGLCCACVDRIARERSTLP